MQYAALLLRFLKKPTVKHLISRFTTGHHMDI